MISLLHQSKFISFLPFFFFFFLIKTLNAQPTYLHSYCYKSGSYTANSSYKSNLDSLISVLRSQSSFKGFDSYTTGSSPTTTVYGTYLCRGDISSLSCETCISRASQNVLIVCLGQKEAIIWYEECFLRYSNRQILSIFDYGPFVTWTTYNTMMYQSYFIYTVESRMDRLIREAYTSSSYFAEETHHVSFLEEVYDLHGLVQCTPDLSQSDCYRCLKWAYNETEDCCYGKRFALVYSTNCLLTYKANFLESPPPPSPPPPPPLSFSRRKRSPNSNGSFSFNLKGKGFRKIIAPVIIAAVVMILAICVCSLCCCCLKKKKKKKEVEERETSREMSTSTSNVAENLTVDQPIAKTESQQLSAN
ncbi:cysteine-rich repeat secretory protein 1 [Eutrema salsugineum]|nr:cysteine-rich repeat secretory protein 1 [Eutrema salsugineum]